MRNLSTMLSLILALMLVAGAAMADTRVISGVVKNANGAPMPQVQVTVKGANSSIFQTTFTNSSGQYSLNIYPCNGDELWITACRACPDLLPGGCDNYHVNTIFCVKCVDPVEDPHNPPNGDEG